MPRLPSLQTHDIKLCMYPFKWTEVQHELKLIYLLYFCCCARTISGEPTRTKRTPVHHKWKQNVQHGGGAFIPCVWEIKCKEDSMDEIKRIELAIAEMEGEGLDMAIKVSYPILIQYIGTESRQREGRELFRYCLYFYFMVVNPSRRCFGPKHASYIPANKTKL
jgi:hypothetical protein